MSDLSAHVQPLTTRTEEETRRERLERLQDQETRQQIAQLMRERDACVHERQQQQQEDFARKVNDRFLRLKSRHEGPQLTPPGMAVRPSDAQLRVQAAAQQHALDRSIVHQESAPFNRAIDRGLYQAERAQQQAKVQEHEAALETYRQRREGQLQRQESPDYYRALVAEQERDLQL